MPRSAPKTLDERLAQYAEEKARGKHKKVTRERNVEGHLKGRVDDQGGTAYKFVSPGRVGVPDRLVLLPIPEEHREIVSRYVRFVELKREGKTPETHQLLEHAHLRGLGYSVEVIDTKAGVDTAFPPYLFIRNHHGNQKDRASGEETQSGTSRGSARGHRPVRT